MGMGVNYGLTCSAVFTLGACIGGFAGTLAIPFTRVVQSMALDILLYTLIVVVVGGAGSVLGSLLGALLIGIVDAFGKSFFPDFAMFSIYMVLIFMLLLRPTGMLGRKQSVEDSGGAPAPILSGGIPGSILFRSIPWILCILAFLVVPVMGGQYLQSMMTRIVIFAIFALQPQPSLGLWRAHFPGARDFFRGRRVSVHDRHRAHGHRKLLDSGPHRGLAGRVVAAVYGVIALRVRGLYFLLVTLALGQLMFYVADRWRSLTGGSNGIIGIPYPDLGIQGFTLDSISYYYFVLLIAAACYFLLYRIVHSPFGQALQGIRDDEKKMQSLGYNTWLHKYIAYVLAGMFPAVAGVLFSYFLVVVAPPQLSITTSTMAILMVIIGSTRVFWGPVAGAVVVILLEYFASVYMPQRWPLLLGAVFVVAVMFMKDGIGVSLLRLYGRVGSLAWKH